MAQSTTQSDPGTDAFVTGSTATPTRTGLSADTKKKAAISAAALLLGGGALAYMVGKTGTLPEPVSPPTNNVPDAAQKPISLPPNAPVANDVNDNMTFEKAFEVARNEVGHGGVFTWHDRAYNTFSKEEWTGLSLQQRQEYAENVLEMRLPVTVNQPAVRSATQPGPTVADPTVIEGMVGDKRVMGIDRDNDGVIDTLVIEGENGYTYQVIDASGDEGLDTLYVYDSVKDEYILAARLDESVVLSNDDFSANLEEAMSKEVVDAIMAEPTAALVNPEAMPTKTDDATDNDGANSDLNEIPETDGDGDTYVNNASVDDMEAPIH